MLYITRHCKRKTRSGCGQIKTHNNSERSVKVTYSYQQDRAQTCKAQPDQATSLHFSVTESDKNLQDLYLQSVHVTHNLLGDTMFVTITINASRHKVQ